MRTTSSTARALVVFLCAFCAIAVASSARGEQPPAAAAAVTDASRRALEIFRKSQVAYREGRFQEAIELLESSYALKPEPVLMYNLARAQEGKGDTRAAIDAYERYLREDPAAADRLSIEQRIVTLRAQIADRAALEKQRDEERRRAEETEKRATGRSSIAPWIVGGSGLAVVGAGVVLTLAGQSRYATAKAEPVQLQADHEYSAAKTLVAFADAAFVVGGITTAGAIVWLVLDTRAGNGGSAARASASLRVGPRSFSIVGTF